MRLGQQDRGIAGRCLHCRMSDGSKASLRALVRSVSAYASPGWQSHKRLLPRASYTKQLQTKREALVFASPLYFQLQYFSASFCLESLTDALFLSVMIKNIFNSEIVFIVSIITVIPKPFI